MTQSAPERRPSLSLHIEANELARLLNLAERRESLVVEIATWICESIIQGELAQGSDLNSVHLAKRFNSSRTPVREALSLLEQEGLVEMRAQKRPRVATLTQDTVREIYMVRATLLSLIARLVAHRASNDDLAALRSLLDEMTEHVANDQMNEYFWCHVALQNRMTIIAGNETLRQILDSLALRTLVLRYQGLQRVGRLRASLDAQLKFMDALEARDAELAALLLDRSTGAALESILSRMSEV